MMPTNAPAKSGNFREMFHSHQHNPEQMGDRKLMLAIVVNVILTAAQVFGGLLSGSLSLVADALHNLNDASALALALIARRVARRPADSLRTFGYRKAEVIGALINTTTLIIVGLYLIYETVSRLFNPQPVDGWIMVIVASIALIVDIATALLTYSMSKSNLNIKAAFVHNVADALGSVAVIIVGVLVLLFDWTIADLIATLLLASYILFQGYRLMSESIRILMDSVPLDVDLEKLAAKLSSVDGVEGVHHIHIWQLDEQRRALEAHVIVQFGNLSETENVKESLKRLLREDFSISHSTLEFELPGHCSDVLSQCNPPLP